MSERRDFIKKSALGTAALVVGGMGFSAKSYGSIMGANERINVAVVGIGGRGIAHINAWADLKGSHNVRLKTLCDTDEQFFGPRSNSVIEKTGIKPSTEWDMRKVLDDKEIDAISFATPNHWHALGSIWACQAGKHVFVEKPASHNIWEGRKMVEAARKYDRRVQVGFQNRSVNNVIEAIKFLHEGGIGEVYMARWGLNKNEHPVSVYSTGGIFGIDPNECAQETPNTQTSVLKYKDGKILEFETRGRYTNAEGKLDVKIGNIFYGSDAYLEINRSTWKAFREGEEKPFAGSKEDGGKEEEAPSLVGSSDTAHWINFIDAMRSGRDETLNCDINEGFYSSALPLMANISYRLGGRQLNFMDQYEKFDNDPAANAMLSRSYRPPYIVPDIV